MGLAASAALGLSLAASLGALWVAGIPPDNSQRLPAPHNRLVVRTFAPQRHTRVPDSRTVPAGPPVELRKWLASPAETPRHTPLESYREWRSTDHERYKLDRKETPLDCLDPRQGPEPTRARCNRSWVRLDCSAFGGADPELGAVPAPAAGQARPVESAERAPCSEHSRNQDDSIDQAGTGPGGRASRRSMSRSFWHSGRGLASRECRSGHG